MMANGASDEFRTIVRLNLLRIDVREDDVYRMMGGHRVEAWGFFVPHDGAFKPRAGGDPSFRQLGQGLWRYDVAGKADQGDRRPQAGQFDGFAAAVIADST